MAQIIPLFSKHEDIVAYVNRQMRSVAKDVADELGLEPHFADAFSSLSAPHLRNLIPTEATILDAKRICDECRPFWRDGILNGLRDAS